MLNNEKFLQAKLLWKQKKVQEEKEKLQAKQEQMISSGQKSVFIQPVAWTVIFMAGCIGCSTCTNYKSNVRKSNFEKKRLETKVLYSIYIRFFVGKEGHYQAIKK